MQPAARCILAARRFTWLGVVSSVINISAPAQIVPIGFRRSWRIAAKSQLASKRLSDRHSSSRKRIAFALSSVVGGAKRDAELIAFDIEIPVYYLALARTEPYSTMFVVLSIFFS